MKNRTNKDYKSFHTPYFLSYIRRIFLIQKNNTDFLIGSPYLWPILWTNKTLGFHTFTNFFKFKFSIVYIRKIIISSLYFILIVKKQVLILDNSYFKERTFKKIIFSWLSESDVNSIIELKRDRHFGDMKYFENDDYQFIYFVNGMLSKNSIDKLKAEKYILIIQEKESIFKYIFKICQRFFEFYKDIFKNTISFVSFFTYEFHYCEDVRVLLKISIIPKTLSKAIILLPYEGQPFQNKIALLFQSINAVVVGYLHDVLILFPSTLIKRMGHPNILIAVGTANKDVLIKYCGWKENEILVLNSLRQEKKKSDFFSNKVFFSYELNIFYIVKSSIDFYLLKYGWEWSILPEIRIHPLRKSCQKHIAMKIELENIFKKYIDLNLSPILKDKIKQNPPCVCIGLTTVVQEALEHGVQVIHICDIPETQMCFESIWPNISVQRIDYNLAVYDLRVKESLIQYGSNESFNSILN